MSNIGNKETMAKNLRFYIERSGKSQKDLAEMVGVATSTFNDWVKGKKYPRIDKIEKLANYFRIQKSDLIEEKEEKNISTNELPLTDGEKMMLELFRMIPEEHQPAALDMLRFALKMQKKL